MPIYEIAGKKVNAQNPLSEEEIDEIYSSITKPQQPKEEPGRFGAAFSRSLHSAKEAVQGVGLGITSAIDTPEHTQDWMNQSRALQNEEVAGPKSMSFEDLQNIYKDKGILSGIAETPGFAAEKFAESSAESLAPFVVGGIAGAFTGGVGAPIVAGITTSIIQQFGHDMARQAQEKIQAGELNPSDAIAAAIPQGVLDYASDRFTFGMKMMPGAKNAIKQAAKEEIEKSIWSRIGGGMVKGAITEPPTEVAQQYLERSQAGLPTDNEEAYREYKEAGGSALAAGALGGGAFGAIERSNQPTQAPSISEPQTTTEELPAEEAVNVDTTRPTSLNEVVAPETESNLIKQKINGEEETIDRNQRIYDKDGNETTAGEYYDKHISENDNLNEKAKLKHAFNSTLKQIKATAAKKQADAISRVVGANQEQEQVEEDVPSTFEEQAQVEEDVPSTFEEQPAPVNNQTERASAASDTSAPLGASSTQEPIKFELSPELQATLDTAKPQVQQTNNVVEPEEEGRFEITPPPEEQPTEEQAVTPPAPKEKTVVKLPKEKVKKATEVIKKVEDNIASGTKYTKSPNALVDIAKDLNVYDAGWTPAQQLTAVKDRLSEAQKLGIAHEGDIFPDMLANTKEKLGLDKKQVEEEAIPKEIKEESDKAENTIKYKKGYKKTAFPSAENFLNQENVIGGIKAPETVSEGIKHAAAIEAVDKLDSVLKKPLLKELKEILITKQEKENARRATKREETKRDKLFAEKQGKPWSKERYNEAIARNKDVEYSIENLRAFMSRKEIADVYHKYSGKKEVKLAANKKTAINNKKAFLDSLTPEQYKEYERLLNIQFENEANANAYSGDHNRTNKINKDAEIVNKIEDQIAAGTKYTKAPNNLVKLAKKLKVYNAEWTIKDQLIAVKNKITENKEVTNIDKTDEKLISEAETKNRESLILQEEKEEKEAEIAQQIRELNQTEKQKRKKEVEEAANAVEENGVELEANAQALMDIIDNARAKTNVSEGLTRDLEDVLDQKSTIDDLLNSLSDKTYAVKGNPTNVIARELKFILANLSTSYAPKIRMGRFEGDETADGVFDPIKNEIVIKGSKGNYTGKRSLNEVVLHEITHALLDHVLENPKAYLKSLPNELQRANAEKAIKRLNVLYKAAKVHPAIKSNFEIGNIKEFVAETMSNPEFQLALGNMPYIGEKEGKGLFDTVSNFFNNVVNTVATILGFKNKANSGENLKVALNDILSLVSRPTETLKASKRSFAKQAPAYVPDGAYDNLDESIRLAGRRADRNKDVTGSATTSWYREMQKNFQNAGVYLKNWQNQLEHAGLIISDPSKKFTNIYDLKTLAQELGRIARKEYIHGAEDNLINDINGLTKALGLEDSNQALNVLHKFKLGVHGQERRKTLYYLNRDLDEAKALKDSTGTSISPKEYRNSIIQLIKTDKLLSKAQTKALWDNVEWVVDNYATPDPKDTIDSDKYNAVGIPFAKEQRYIQDYNNLAANNPAAKAYVDAIFDSLKKLNENTITLNKKSNYHSNPVDNIINFYGWEHYSPFKGIPEHNATVVSFNRDNLLTSNTFNQMADPWTGGIEDSENCIVQTISDAYKAADRAGYNDVTEAIKNASETKVGNRKLLNASVVNTLSFADREQFKELGQKLKDKSILHYNKNGSVDIIEFDESAMPILNSIKKQYIPTNRAINFASALTSTIAQLHTRYNVNFAPMNFVRDMLTNAWTMGAEKGMGMSAKYISTIAADVVGRGGIFRALKIANMYEKHDIAGIRALTTGKNSIDKNIAEYILHGGKVSHRAAMSLKENYDRMERIGEKKYLAHTSDSINTIVDTWNEMFELASRSSAYKTFKSNYIKNGMDETAAGIKAAADAKNLANFEQVGLHSKTLGAFFMFSRPAATGAVRALDALLPAFTFKESWALKNLDNSGVFAYEVDPNTHKRIYKNQKAVNDYIKGFKEQRKHAQVMVGTLIGMGMATYAMAVSMADDDDKGRNKVSNDNPDQWTKFARFHIGDDIYQVPWGFGLGAFAAIGAQIAMANDPNNKVSWKDAFSNIATQISFDSYLPIPVSRIDFVDDPLQFAVDSVTPSLGRPLVEYVMNKNGLGQSIYSTSPSGSTDNAYSGGEKVPELYKSACRWLANVTNGVVDIAPNTAYFFANNYADGVSRLGEIANGAALSATGQKEFDLRKDVPFIGSFVGAEANVDAREFGKVEDKIQSIKSKLDMFKSNPTEYREYVAANPMAPAIVEIYEKINGRFLNKLYHANNMYRRNPDLTPSERQKLMKPITDNINNIKYTLVNMVEKYDIHPN
jgi:hypothetical protein